MTAPDLTPTEAATVARFDAAPDAFPLAAEAGRRGEKWLPLRVPMSQRLARQFESVDLTFRSNP